MNIVVRKTKSRFASRPVVGDPAPRRIRLSIDHPAVDQGRTLFLSKVVRDPLRSNVLISAFNSRKIGGEVLRGKWIGFPIYTVTLEERATCPRSCLHWRNCYGNKMHHAKRLAAGQELEIRIENEIAAIADEHPGGFAVRLHTLGDFYSVPYVLLWRDLLARHAALHVFGYTARHEWADPIARALIALVADQWDRFAVRFSNAPIDEKSTVSIRNENEKPADAIICPEQMGQTESCSTCGLCWQTTKRIAFLQH